MAFFRTVSFSEPLPVVEGDGVYLRAPQMNDYGDWAELRESSRAFLTPWEPTWPADDLTRGAFRRRLRPLRRGPSNGPVLSVLPVPPRRPRAGWRRDLANIRRGVAQAGSVGYWMGARHAGQGQMTRGLRALIPFAFATLRLHRLEAACIPSNAASIRLLEKTGFTREGYAREYLCINGLWQDHLLFAQLAGDLRR
ncbi:MAG: GNAT family N-acetyltransferase [Pseudorhodoplanes sp.]|nr:GNAT family N-acetyltransferase [Pseudorhodoplanes sp.]